MKSLQSGQQIFHYSLWRRLGQGGQGEVWLARDEESGELVALKFAHSPRWRKLWSQRGEDYLRLIHPGIVRILTLELDADPPFLVLEYVEGDSLAEVLTQAPPPWELSQIEELFSQILPALQYAHQKGLYHLDIKPSNLLKDKKGNWKLTDFGMPLAPPLELSKGLSSSSSPPLSFGYSAPELWESPFTPLPQSDIYSLGVLLFYLLTGHLPQGLSLPSSLNPSLSPLWDKLLQKTLSLKPEERPESAEAFRRLLEEALEKPLLLPPLKVKIPEGSFFFGSSQSFLPTFWISPYPVTCGEYYQFCLSTGHPLPSRFKRRRGRWYTYEEPYLPSSLVDTPVVEVNFEDALGYAQWKGGDLPTELEWEKAARGTDGRPYPWGFEWRGNCLHWRAEAPVSVYSYPEGQSPYGCFHMLGNVWEWCRGESAASLQPLRGGSFQTEKSLLHCTARATLHRSTRRPDLGFRVVWRKT